MDKISQHCEHLEQYSSAARRFISVLAARREARIERHPAIDKQAGPGDIVRHIGCKEHRGIANILGSPMRSYGTSFINDA